MTVKQVRSENSIASQDISIDPQSQYAEDIIRKLIVVVPALGGNCMTWIRLMKSLQHDALKGYEVLYFDHGLGLFSLGKARKTARRLYRAIELKYKNHSGFDEIVLVGHSFGALLAREAYLQSSEKSDQPGNSQWCDAVTRIVIFAGISRGWCIDTGRLLRWFLKFLKSINFILFSKFIFTDILKGSAFINNLSIRWIRKMHALRQSEDQFMPLVFHLVGTEDKVVNKEDSKSEYPYAEIIPIPDGEHSNLYRLLDAPDPQERYELIKRAFVMTRDEYDHNLKDLKYDYQLKNILILLHGIRDEHKQWMKEFSDFVVKQKCDLMVDYGNYDYFGVWNLVMPHLRRKPIPEFEQQYIDLLAKYPNGRFYFIGHSNGTYILGKSLKRLPSMIFRRVVLAGCVLSPKYDWAGRFRQHQVEEFVSNICANNDKSVAIGANLLRSISFIDFGLHDIGSAGFTGFKGANNNDLIKGNKIVETKYIDGSHGIAMQEAYFGNLLVMLMDKQLPKNATKDTHLPGKSLSILSRLASSLGILLLGALAYVEYLFLSWVIEANDFYHWFVLIITHYVAIMVLRDL